MRLNRRNLSRKKYVIFGGGNAAKDFLLNFPYKDKLSYMVDNNVEKRGMVFEGLRIEGPEKLLTEDKGDVLIFIASSYYKEISEQLVGMGFKKSNNFLVWNGKLKLLKRVYGGGIKFLHSRICGIHPYNTIFSFNYHNVSKIIRDIKEYSTLFQGKLVDIGAGKSPYYDLFNVDEYTAVDFPNSLPKSEKREIQQVTGDVLKLPLGDETFDCAVSMQVLEHVSDTNLALSEINRILKVGGLVLISVPHISPIHLEPHDYYRFTPIGMSTLLKRNGFSIISSKQQGGVFASLALTLNMDIVISKYDESTFNFKPSIARMVFLSPLIGLINSIAFIMDKIYKSDRSPTNIFVIARKESSAHN
ncbi:class I SAM-dependent methyltransferase [Cohnella sp.]|uniref:class I SAM-dependent methyltransferase n=1 Tax=Cohnella sp. TaxID=1883426 RepID=UPI00356232C8